MTDILVKRWTVYEIMAMAPLFFTFFEFIIFKLCAIKVFIGQQSAMLLANEAVDYFSIDGSVLVVLRPLIRFSFFCHKFNVND